MSASEEAIRQASKNLPPYPNASSDTQATERGVIWGLIAIALSIQELTEAVNGDNPS